MSFLLINGIRIVSAELCNHPLVGGIISPSAVIGFVDLALKRHSSDPDAPFFNAVSVLPIIHSIHHNGGRLGTGMLSDMVEKIYADVEMSIIVELPADLEVNPSRFAAQLLRQRLMGGSAFPTDYRGNVTDKYDVRIADNIQGLWAVSIKSANGSNGERKMITAKPNGYAMFPCAGKPIAFSKRADLHRVYDEVFKYAKARFTYETAVKGLPKEEAKLIEKPAYSELNDGWYTPCPIGYQLIEEPVYGRRNTRDANAPHAMAAAGIGFAELVHMSSEKIDKLDTLKGIGWAYAHSKGDQTILFSPVYLN